jgi:peptidoglycan hydrolase-like protein with peptidoglycan-binding domain
MFLPTNITLKLGDSGDFVAELQRRLSVINCFSPDAINGFFDGLTANAVSQFQSMSGIHADGIAGPETLRRLNGALSGDNSSTTNQAEEEAKKRAEEERLRLEQQAAYLLQQQQQAYFEQQAMLAQQQQAQAAAAYIPPVQAAPAAPVMEQPQPQAYAPPQPQAYAPPQPQAYAPAPQAQATQPAQPAAMTAGDMLAQMLLQAAQQPQAQPQQQRPVQQASTQPQVLAQIETQQIAVTAEPRGIVGRAVQYANEIVQKLANYFESKLPAPVINEVKQIGLTMARAGMQEAPIASAEQQKERGVEQGKGQQQGIQRS